ncbi:MAG: lysine 2,3-aminomutase [Deltaproteobacteria bacterium]|nr:lysine 2,3-aminomutase [Deltaproteobacteria bacterium]
MQVVAHVFPFRVNNYVVDHLIDWGNPADPIFRLTFPQRHMLSDEDFARVEAAMRSGEKARLNSVVTDVRNHLNPHPSGQMTSNVPHFRDGTLLSGVQHKYERTVLFFPRQGQSCHAYCNFCFRWPQFVGDPSLRIETSDIDPLIAYLREHEEIRDVLFTGGDPFIMRSGLLRRYVDALLSANLEHIKSIRFGTKALTYWPYRFTSDDDSTELLECLTSIIKAGKHATIMAHFNHPNELAALPAQEALKRIQNCGAQVRTQTPLLRGINDNAQVLAQLWEEQVRLGCIPYYLFATRDTGAQRFFGVPLAESLALYVEALHGVSRLAATVRGPVMSSDPGKILVQGISEVLGQKVFVLQLLQSRHTEWAGRLFYAQYDPRALWINELKPAFGEKAFFFDL